MNQEVRINELEGKLREMRRAAEDPVKTDATVEVEALEGIVDRIGPFPLPPVYLRTHVGTRPTASNWEHATAGD